MNTSLQNTVHFKLSYKFNVDNTLFLCHLIIYLKFVWNYCVFYLMQLSFSPATPLLTHAKVLMLLTGIHLTCLALLCACVAIGYFYSGINTFAFLAAEVGYYSYYIYRYNNKFFRLSLLVLTAQLIMQANKTRTYYRMYNANWSSHQELWDPYILQYIWCFKHIGGVHCSFGK